MRFAADSGRSSPRLSRVRVGSGSVAILSRFAEIAGSLSAPVVYHYRLWSEPLSVAVWQKENGRQSENTQKGQ